VGCQFSQVGSAWVVTSAYGSLGFRREPPRAGSNEFARLCISGHPFFLRPPQSVLHLHTMYTVKREFSGCVACDRKRMLQSAPQKLHGLCKCEFPEKSTLRVVSFLCASLCGRRALSGHEGLSASVVLEPFVGIMGLRATRLFARRRAVVAPRECAYPAIL